MGRLANIWGRIKLAAAIVLDRFEAAYQRWGERSLLWGALQDSRLDLDSMTREELQRRHRHWVANSELVQRIRCLHIQFTSGVSGLAVVPNSDDEDWNHIRASRWQDWGRRPEIDSNLPIGQVTIQWAGALFDDGEVFINKVAINGRPAIQTIEAHRVCTPTEKADDKSIIDGIKYELLPDGGIGRPLVYYVKTTSPTGDVTWKPLAAANVIHVFKARRPGQLRGIPEGFAGLNTLHDYQDLHLLEMQVARLSAELGTVETNPMGELSVSGTRRARLNTTSQNASGLTVTKPSDAFYSVTLGGKRIALKSGDSIEQFMIKRPTVVQQQYWDLLLTQICCAYNVPKLLVVPYSLQGTVTRADLDICANAFRMNFELVAWALRQVYEWQTQWAVNFDRGMDGQKPQDFIECIIRPPRAPNVDIGYTAQALQIELEIGTKTLQDVYAERQQDWRHQLRQIAETEAYIDQLADEFGIDPNRISQKAKQPVAPAAEPDGDEGKSAKPKSNEETEEEEA